MVFLIIFYYMFRAHCVLGAHHLFLLYPYNMLDILTHIHAQIQYISNSEGISFSSSQALQSVYTKKLKHYVFVIAFNVIK